MEARPGEQERWRIVNASVARYLRLRLDGQQLQLLGIDSGRYPAPQEVQEIVLPLGTGPTCSSPRSRAAANCARCPTTAAARAG